MKNKMAWIGIGVFILYFIYNWFSYVPLSILGINYNNLSLFSKTLYLLMNEFIFILIIIFIYRQRFKRDLKDYLHNFKPYMKKYMEYWALAFGLMLLSNFIIVSIAPNSVATNQEAVNDIFNKAPLYMIISAVFFAPFIEESIFRLSFRNIFKNNTLFIIISGIVFGSLHVLGSFTNVADLLYIIPYSIPGLVFAYTLVKSDNIFIPMSLHFFHNGIMMLVQTIIMFLL